MLVNALSVKPCNRSCPRHPINGVISMTCARLPSFAMKLTVMPKRPSKSACAACAPLARQLEIRSAPGADLIRGSCRAVPSRMLAAHLGWPRVVIQKTCNHPASLSARSLKATGQACFTAIISLICSVPITSWSHSLVPTATWHGVPPGAKVPSPTLTIRGSVKMAACAATRRRPFEAADLTPAHPQDGQTLRQTLEGPQQRRVRCYRFRRAPPTSLAALEKDLLQLILPS
jgi:hypothetical protein